jgi:hypothetical protein
MLKPMLLKLVRKEAEREEDRGEKAPVLLARPNRLAKRLGRASRGYALVGAGVVVGAVGFVSLLSWLAPDSDRPIGHPLEVVERVAGGVLEQVDDKVAALLGTTEGETMSRDVRKNLTAVGSRIPWSGRVSEITPDRYSASSGPSTPIPTTRSTLNTPAQEEPSSSATNEPPPTTYAPSPSSTNPPSSTNETPPSAAKPQLPTTTDEPPPPPPATEEPPTPPVEEPLPTTEQPPPAEEPPIEEVPPPTGPPPTTEEPAPPPTTDQTLRPPAGLA